MLRSCRDNAEADVGDAVVRAVADLEGRTAGLREGVPGAALYWV